MPQRWPCQDNETKANEGAAFYICAATVTDETQGWIDRTARHGHWLGSISGARRGLIDSHPANRNGHPGARRFRTDPWTTGDEEYLCCALPHGHSAHRRCTGRAEERRGRSRTAPVTAQRLRSASTAQGKLQDGGHDVSVLCTGFSALGDGWTLAMDTEERGTRATQRRVGARRCVNSEQRAPSSRSGPLSSCPVPVPTPLPQQQRSRSLRLCHCTVDSPNSPSALLQSLHCASLPRHHRVVSRSHAATAAVLAGHPLCALRMLRWYRR